MTNTVAWLPEPLRMPGSQPLEIVHDAVNTLVSALATLTNSVDQLDPNLRQPLSDQANDLSASLQRFAKVISPHMLPTNDEQPAEKQRVETITNVNTIAEQRVAEANADSPRQNKPILVETVEDDDSDNEDDSEPPHGSKHTHSGRPVKPPTRYPDNCPPATPAATIPTTTWKRGSRGGRNHSKLPSRQDVVHHVLNLTPKGDPLTFKSATAGEHANSWRQADDAEFDRLISTTKTMAPIQYQSIPSDRRRDICPYVKTVREKLNKLGELLQRVRGTAGNNRNYSGQTDAENVDLPVVKMLLVDVVSDRKNGKQVTCKTFDITDFYLGTKLDQLEYVRVNVKHISPHIMDKYNLHAFVNNGSVYFEVSQAMYGLKQSGRLSWKRLVSICESNGYTQPSPDAPGLYSHSNGTMFVLSTDDFLCKFLSAAAEDHFTNMLAQHYAFTVDHTASKYLGITIEFDNSLHSVTLSMPSYVPNMLHRFYGKNLPKIANSPAVYEPPSKGTNSQQVKVDNTPLVSEAERTIIQQKIGCILHLARAVDVVLLEAINHAASNNAQPTQATVDQVERTMGYLVQFPNPRLVLHACDMVLHSQSDASYLSRSHARSVAGGIHFLGNHNEPDLINGPIIAISSITPTVCASACEAEYGAVFINAQVVIWLRNVLAAMGHPQAKPTRIRCDNQCAVGLANLTVKPKRSKAIDMRYHWTRDKIKNSLIDVYWWPGAENLADFFTKALPVHKFQELKPNFVHSVGKLSPVSGL